MLRFLLPLLLAACHQLAPAPEALVLSGPATVSGTQADFRLELGPDAAWRLLLGGPLGGEWTSDGAQLWERSWNNPPRELHGSQREELFLAMHALREGRDHASDGGDDAIHFEEWSERAGARVPARIRRGDLAGSHDLLEVHEVRRERVARFAPPADPPRDWSFAPDAAAELELRVAKTGHLLVHPRVDGQDLGWFIFDSGAGAMCLDAAAPARLGIAPFGRVTAVGVAGRDETAFARATALTLGPLTMDAPIFVLLDLAFLAPYFEVPIAGIIGHELFARAIVEYEAAPQPRIALHPREEYALAAGAAWQEMTVTDRVPVVRARFEGGREDWFRLDTGANGTIAFHAPAVRRYGLLEGRATEAGAAGGVGGVGEVRVGPLEWFELGGRRFEQLQAQFYVGEIGAFADADTAGNVGLDVLREFRLVFDVRGARIAFLPR
jgi:hypothetical protein